MIQLFKDKKYWREMGIILLFGIIINIACFCMPLVVHAETPVNYYPVTSGMNNFSVLSLEQIFYKCNQIAEYDFTNVNYVVRVDDIATSSYPNARSYYILVWDKELNENPFYIELSSNTYFEFHKVSNTASTFSYRVYEFYDWRGDLSDTNFNHVYYSSSLSSINGYSPLYRQNVDYIFNVTINLNQPYNTISPVLQATIEEINIGNYTDLPPLDEILNNLTDTYTPDFSPVYPNIDTNKTDIENEKSFFDTLSQGITQNFNNLGANLQKFFNKIQEKLTNVGNAISTNIHNGFATLMQNIRDFFGPKLDKIIELLTRMVNDDEEDVKQVWESTQIYQDFDSISQFTSTGFAVWQDTSEPDTYKIPFHVEQIPLLHCDTVQYIDLGLFSPVIPYIRSIMWALMVYSVFYTVVDSLANYINGGDE